jgi:predicted HAD superfamily Cof-like phosphohydrolase
MSYFSDVKDFHVFFERRVGEYPELPDAADMELRLLLIWEEYDELRLAHEAADIVEVADAIADLIYVACGMAVAYGIPLDAVWDEVHGSNMRKVDDNGRPIFREDGKVLKPAGWKGPDIGGVLFGADQRNRLG